MNSYDQCRCDKLCRPSEGFRKGQINDTRFGVAVKMIRTMLIDVITLNSPGRSFCYSQFNKQRVDVGFFQEAKCSKSIVGVV